MTTSNLASASASPRAMFFASTSLSPLVRGPQVAYSPEDGALSVEQAMEALRAPAPDPETPQAQEEPAEAVEPEAEAPADPETEAEPTAEEIPDPETPAIEDEPQDPEPESDPDLPAIAAPRSWDADERAAFATLPRQAQEIILKRESERDQAVSKAQQEASTVRKQAQAELEALAQYKAAFDQIATRANKVFADKWANVDWVALARQDPAAYTIAKAEYEADAGELQRVQLAQAEADKANQQAEQVKFQNYVQEQFAELARIAPDLADPKEGTAKRTEVTQFLLGQGIPQESVRQISAVEMALARDAMEYRKLKASGQTVAAKPAPKPVAPTKPAPARAAAPTAAAPARSTQQRSIEAVRNRFAQTGSTEDAVALLRASRGAR